MSSHEKNLSAFSFLLDARPDLFEKYRAELQKLGATLPEDLEKASDAIALWCKQTDRSLWKALIAAHNAIDNNATDSAAEQERIFNSHIEPVSPSEERHLIVTTVKNKMQRDSQSSNSTSDAASKPPSQS
ncbi:hypothetical protein [Laspinema olomoucense]|uniref:hypothetical protein n=1 Tax=Laspinema olomoucense TaxID=3231600 RepID=UPI0021BA8478|nr:hypothetical protein [Laspinema sp. D3d]MCT7973415.1 hypothetical protein [Laspinema sp. D3d]